MSDIRFNSWLHQSGTGGVYQDSAGEVGIGTTVPTSKLHVVGDVRITGAYIGDGSQLSNINTSAPVNELDIALFG